MLVTVLMGTLFSRVLPLAFTHLGFNCSSWKDLVDSTEGSLNPWAGTIVEIQHNDCYHVGPFSCQATTHNSRMLTLNPHRVESGVIYSIYVVLDVVFPDVRMLHFRRFLTSSSYLSTGTAAPGCGPCPSCGTSFLCVCCLSFDTDVLLPGHRADSYYSTNWTRHEHPRR